MVFQELIENELKLTKFLDYEAELDHMLQQISCQLERASPIGCIKERASPIGWMDAVPVCVRDRMFQQHQCLVWNIQGIIKQNKDECNTVVQ